MASSAPTSLPWWLTGCTYDGNGGDDLRNSGVTPYFYPLGPAAGTSTGVLPGVLGAGLAVSAASGMNVSVQGGSFLVSAPAATNGGYVASLTSQATLSIATSDPVNPRIDLVCATVTDNGNSSSYGEVQVVTGTPASSPSAPSTPAASIRLAYVTVPALATSIVSGDIADERPYTCAAGGIVRMPVANAPAGYAGQFAYDIGTDRLYHNAGAGPRQARVLAFAPQTATWGSGAAIGNPSLGGPTTLTTPITVDCDGVTDLKVTYHVPGIYMPSPANGQVKFCVLVDGTQIDETDAFTASGDAAGISGHGFTGIYHTSSVTGDTPAAGSHSVTLTAEQSVNATTYVTSSSGRTGYLRVEPVTL